MVEEHFWKGTKHVFDTFLPRCWSQKGPFSRQIQVWQIAGKFGGNPDKFWEIAGKLRGNCNGPNSCSGDSVSDGDAILLVETKKKQNDSCTLSEDAHCSTTL